LRNIIVALLVLPLLAILQSTLLPYFSWYAVFKVNLVLVTVLSWNLVYPHTEGVLWALIGGLMMDSLSGSHMGTSIIALCIASLIANWAGSRAWSSNIILRLFTSISGIIIYYLIYLLLLATTGWSADWTSIPINHLLPSTIINALATILILPILRWLSSHTTRQGVGYIK